MSSDLPALLGRPLLGLDLLRGRALAVAGPLAPSLLRDRERRVVVYGLVATAGALVLTFLAPALLLAFGPILLGVPHLASDVRYLVVRPGLHRRLDVVLLVLGPACASWLVPSAAIAMLSVIGAALAAQAPFARRMTVAIAGCGLVYVTATLGSTADLALAHLHNAVAIALFVMWSRGGASRRSSATIGVAFVSSILAIALGAFDGGPAAALARSGLLDPGELSASLAPGATPLLASRIVLAFAFAQSMHYAVWLRLVPERDRPRPGMRPFASSLRALRSDLGVTGVAAFALVTLAIGGWACLSPAAARDGYLRLAVFHGPLELGAAALLLLEGRLGACARTGRP